MSHVMVCQREQACPSLDLGARVGRAGHTCNSYRTQAEIERARQMEARRAQQLTERRARQQAQAAQEAAEQAAREGERSLVEEVTREAREAVERCLSCEGLSPCPLSLMLL